MHVDYRILAQGDESVQDKTRQDKTRQLGDVDEVHIVDLRGRHADCVSEYMKLRDLESVRVTGPEAESIADLWRRLPKGEQMRCHIPPFGLSFFKEGQLLVEASLCWECNNAFGFQGDDSIAFEFDAKGRASRALLTRIKALWT